LTVVRDHHLRIIARRGDQHALLGWVNVDTVDGEVKYAGQMLDVTVWRHSYHKSGVRTYYPLPDVVVERPEPGPPAAQFVGTEQLAMPKMPLDTAIWDYTPKRKHTNLTIDADEICEVDVWMVEAGRSDLVQRTIDAYPHVLRTALLGDCDPMVLAVKWSFPPEVQDEIGPVRLYSMASLIPPVTPPEGDGV
jgi:hypothetical protein